jgi:hypothetical protein
LYALKAFSGSILDASLETRLGILDTVLRANIMSA